MVNPAFLLSSQVVKLKNVFPHGTGFVLVFEYMLSDLSEVIRNSQEPLAESQVKGYMLMLLKGVAFCHENSIMHRVRLTLKCVIFIHALNLPNALIMPVFYLFI